MYEIHNYVNRPRAENFRLYLQQYPSSKWGFVGTIPICLAEHRTNSIGQDYFDSKIYDTKEEAINDAKLNGYEMGKLYPIGVR